MRLSDILLVPITELVNPDAPIDPNWRRRFDVLVVVHSACDWHPVDPGLNLVAKSSVTDVYRVLARSAVSAND